MELQTREGWYDGVQEDINKKKRQSLGKTLTLKSLLDCWWNSVRLNGNIIFKNTYTCDPEYAMYGADCGQYDISSDKDLLYSLVETDDYCDFDSDGYPIVFANNVDFDFTNRDDVKSRIEACKDLDELTWLLTKLPAEFGVWTIDKNVVVNEYIDDDGRTVETTIYTSI